MNDLASLKELNRTPDKPEDLKTLLNREFKLNGRVFKPVLSPLRDETCSECALRFQDCNSKIYDDNGTIVPDCYNGYSHPVYYK